MAKIKPAAKKAAPKKKTAKKSVPKRKTKVKGVNVSGPGLDQPQAWERGESVECAAGETE